MVENRQHPGMKKYPDQPIIEGNVITFFREFCAPFYCTLSSCFVMFGIFAADSGIPDTAHGRRRKHGNNSLNQFIILYKLLEGSFEARAQNTGPLICPIIPQTSRFKFALDFIQERRRLPTICWFTYPWPLLFNYA